MIRFWSKVDQGTPDVCWPWRAHLNDDGYGTFKLDGKSEKAHRVAFFLTYGRWPEPCGIHSCDNRACCNPSHVSDGTHQQNMADRDAKGRHRAPRNGGERNPSAKLTAQDVMDIRATLALCRVKQKDVAAMFSVSKSRISLIARGLSW